MDFRRDIGIWAGMVGLFHVAVGQCVHLRGRPWLYYIYENWQHKHALPVCHDLFGLANYSGLFAALVLLALVFREQYRAMGFTHTQDVHVENC